MAKFEMYQQFENRKTGRIAHVARIDETCKTIVLMYDETREGDKENGVPLSYPSVSKSWKRLDTYAHPDLSASEVNTEDKAGDGTSYSEVMQEIIQDGKTAVAKAKCGKQVEKTVTDTKKSEQSQSKTKKSKKSPIKNPDAQLLFDFVIKTVESMNCEVFIPANGMKMRSFKTGGHMFAKINFSSKGVTLACRSSAVNVPCDKKINHLFDNLYVFTTFDTNSKTTIKTLLKDACKHQQAKNATKNKKEEK